LAFDPSTTFEMLELLLPLLLLQANGLKLSNAWEGYHVLLNPDYRAQARAWAAWLHGSGGIARCIQCCLQKAPRPWRCHQPHPSCLHTCRAAP
jgi:hypothetical protein